MLLRGHMQNSYATHDLDKAMEVIGNDLGIEKFDRFDPDMVVKTPQGEKPLSVRVASFWSGGLNIELIEPVSGWVDPYVSVLPADRTDAVPRFHHISLRREDEAAMRAEIASLPFPVAYEGPYQQKNKIPSLVFIFVDARKTFGHFIEFTWKSPEGWEYVGWPKGRPIY
jgi:hypothetical protein